MSLYAALYGNPKLPASLQCICGRTFQPEKDRETYCSSNCAREDSMRGLLGNDTLYRKNALNELQQARQPLLGRKPKKVPSRLDLKQEADDRPPTPLPKSARHLPQKRRDQPRVKEKEKAPSVPPLMLNAATAKGRDIPPTPPPKSARHLHRMPRHREANKPPPMPTVRNLYASPQTGNSQRPQASFQARSGSTSRVAPAATSTAARSISAHHHHKHEVPTAVMVAQLPARQPPPKPSYTIYAEPTQDTTTRAPEVRRANSLPFLQRGLDPSTKLGKQYHPQPQRPAIYAPAPAGQAIPISPPPAYSSGGVYSHGHTYHSTPAIVPAQTKHRPPVTKAATSRGFDDRTPTAVTEREVRQSKSTNHLRSASTSRSTRVVEGSGDVWWAVRGLRTDDEEDYRERFLNRRTPRY